jgi:hypothetical protein
LWICIFVRVLVALERIRVDMELCQSTGGIEANACGYGDMSEYWWHWSESFLICIIVEYWWHRSDTFWI